MDYSISSGLITHKGELLLFIRTFGVNNIVSFLVHDIYCMSFQFELQNTYDDVQSKVLSFYRSFPSSKCVILVSE